MTYEPPSRLRIVTVEGDAAQEAVLREGLAVLGHEVVAHAYTAGGVVLLAEKLKPDLVIIDIDLGGGLDGIRAAGEIQSKLGIDVILSSRGDYEEVRLRALKVDFLAFLLKPYDEDDLATVLAQGRSRMGRKSHTRYRRQEGSVVWHWCENCSTWPASGKFVQANFLPAEAQLCNECWIRNQDGACDKPAE
jgi:CheY-like chemotaxis protein